MANAQSLMDYLTGPVLTELVASQDVAPGLPKPFPAAFYEYSDTECVGVNVQWDAVQGVRTPATVVDPMSPSRRVETNARTRRQAVAIGSKESWVLDTELLTMLQSNIPLLQNRARNVMRQNVLDFRQRADNLQVTLPHAAIALGYIAVDRNGNVLPTSSGASVKADFGLVYGGSNALTKTSNWPGTSVVVGDWSNAATDIPSSLRTMDQAFTFVSNYQARNIIYGKNIPGYFYNNTAMQTYLSRQPALNEQLMLTNEVPKGLLTYNWFPGDKAYYVDQNGATQKFVGDDEIKIFPDIDESWFEFVLTSQPCPKGLIPPGATIEQFLEACPAVRGYSSYAHSCMDPLSLAVTAQIYSLPTVKNNLVLWHAKIAN